MGKNREQMSRISRRVMALALKSRNIVDYSITKCSKAICIPWKFGGFPKASLCQWYTIKPSRKRIIGSTTLAGVAADMTEH